MIELTDEAIKKLLQKKTKEQFSYIRLGITGGGCAGFEYVFDAVDVKSDTDILLDFGKLKFIVDKVSIPYLNGMTLDFQKQGLNEIFVFQNPKETSSCGCGVSINFDLNAVEEDSSKIFAIEV
jgi:iron-sulfur cluster assembly accessory protein